MDALLGRVFGRRQAMRQHFADTVAAYAERLVDKGLIEQDACDDLCAYVEQLMNQAAEEDRENMAPPPENLDEISF